MIFSSMYDEKVEYLKSHIRLVDTSWHSLDAEFCRENALIPIESTDHSITFALIHPISIDLLQDLFFLFSKSIHFVFIDEKHLQELINNSFQVECVESKPKIEDEKMATLELNQEKHLPEPIRLLNRILKEAILDGASDIHFEPHKEQLAIRYRIDGILQQRHLIEAKYHSHIITRLKILANLDIAEKRRPLDGRITFLFEGRPIDFRLSTLCVADGQRIVLRILDQEKTQRGLCDLGMPSALLTPFQRALKRKEGLILVTGPTGSGKTTTLYSAVQFLHQPALNIMTIEDPIEYQMPHIAQMGVHSQIGVSFAKGLRHILRQDPDIILIGEIRDIETAQIALQASFTGHLVLSTLHTQDAPSAINRLIEMGVDSSLLASTLIGVLTQRLVRKRCPAHHLESIKNCPHCFGTDFFGRKALFEWMQVSKNMQSLIKNKPTNYELLELAKKEGMKTLIQEAQEAILKGEITRLEASRVLSDV